jgi:hypothetical protein
MSCAQDEPEKTKETYRLTKAQRERKKLNAVTNFCDFIR